MVRRRRPPRRAPEPGRAPEIGAALRAERERRGLTAEQVGESIRFSARHVLAVEEARFEDLPPRPYARGVVAAYVAHLGLGPESVEDYLADVAAPGAGRRRSVFRHPRREGLNWRNWTVPIACAIATLAYAVAVTVLAPERTPLPEPPAAARPAAVGTPGEPQGEAPGDAAGPGAAPDAAAGPAGAPATGPASAETAAAPAGGPPPGVTVLLRSEGTTWVDAAADGGETRRHELGPGQNLELAARERLALALGDAGVVRVKVGERDLGFIGFKGETRTGMLFTARPPSPRPAAKPATVAAPEGD